jgi:2-methylcitrate dehydratase PrpD
MGKLPPWTRRLAGHCQQVAKQPLTEQTIHAVKRATFDAIVCALAGTVTDEMMILQTALALPFEPPGRLARPGKSPLSGAAAALYDGACAHALELDDTHSFSSVHGAGPIVMAVLAAAGSPDGLNRTSGLDVLRAIAVGYESACRLGGACRGSSPYARGFHPTGVYGVFGAAAAVGALLGLDADTYADAFGIAGSLASGLMACVADGSWSKKLHAGWAAHGGIVAASLAAQGFRGPHSVLEGPFGFVDAHCDQPDAAYMFADLVNRREVERISFKPFACCRSIHPAITATLAAVDGHELQADDIAAIALTIADEDIDLVAEPRDAKIAPTTTEEAQFSLYWGTAVAAALRRATRSEFTPSVIASPELLRLASVVSYQTDPEMTALRPELFPCRATVTLRDGRILQASVRAPRGDFRNPMEDHELLRKARGLLSGGPVDAAQLFEAIWTLDTAHNLGELLDLAWNPLPISLA